MKRLLCTLLIISSFNLDAQELKFTGTVMSEREVLPFATIGILDRNIGTIADEYGRFELTLPNVSIQDTVIVSYLGYKRKSYIPFLLSQLRDLEINLEKEVIQLTPVVVVDKRARDVRLGGKKEKSAYVWISAQGKGAEVATLMRPKSSMFLKKVGSNLQPRR